MYDLSKLIKGLRNPRRALWEFGWVFHRKILNRSGVHILDEDWDCLIILDACRYDLFKQEVLFPGSLQSRISAGSNTGEFLRNNFGDETVNDTVYVSANPQVQNYEVDDNFHDCVRLWESDWNDELRTVPPENVAEAAVNARKKYPNKRLIVHFIQPHYPFIGETGKDIEHATLDGGGILSEKNDQKPVWGRMKDGDISKQKVWKAYRENLNLTVPHLEMILSELDEKIVITSDHGNSFGRWSIYGHPPKHYLSDLVKVPWLVIENSTRIDVVSEEPSTTSSVNKDVEDRLSDLGYV